MAVTNFRTCYLSVTNATTPFSPDSQSSSALPLEPGHPRRTRVVLPKKKPLKWSTGVAPGEYGGPPTTSKLRKYWGEDVDPLASDDFMWNKDFMGRMKKLINKPESSSESLDLLPSKEQRSGFLNLNRVMSLDSMEIDLSKELTAPAKPVLEHQVEAARRGTSMADNADVSSPRWRLVPTRREQEKWDRAAKATTWGSDVMLRDVKKVRGDPKVLAAQSREQYLKLKKKLQLLTMVIGGVGVLSAYVSYSPEIAASFGAGLLGSLVYIRMLGNSVDSMANGVRGFANSIPKNESVKKFPGLRTLYTYGPIERPQTSLSDMGAAGQPRLLVPVVLVMVYNRWNGMLVPDYGFMHLDLIPMLVGFFTYKIATFAQAVEVALTPSTAADENNQVLYEPESSGGHGCSLGRGSKEEAVGDAMIRMANEATSLLGRWNPTKPQKEE